MTNLIGTLLTDARVNPYVKRTTQLVLANGTLTKPQQFVFRSALREGANRLGLEMDVATQAFAQVVADARAQRQSAKRLLKAVA